MGSACKSIAASVAGLIALALLAGCSAASAAHTQQDVTKLEGVAWSVTQLRAGSGSLTPLIPGSRITSRLESGTVAGKASVNSYSGKYMLANADTMVFTLGHVSTMAGPDPLMAQENEYLSALADARSFRVSADALQVLDSAGKELIVFARDKRVSLAGRMWYCTGYGVGTNALNGVVGKSTISVMFTADGHVTGSSGVNQYGTSCKANGAKLRIDPIFLTTRMSGPTSLVDQERAYFRAVRSTTSYQIDGDRLIFWDGPTKVATYALTR